MYDNISIKAHFPAAFHAILNRIATIDPVAYSNSRNYLHGAVSYLSPYISRGVISHKICLSRIIEAWLSSGSYYEVYIRTSVARLLATSLDC